MLKLQSRKNLTGKVKQLCKIGQDQETLKSDFGKGDWALGSASNQL